MNALLSYMVLYAFFFVFLSHLQVERGSPKSCFLFLGYVLCEINWVSVLSDAWNPNPHPQTHNMIVCLLYMMVLLAKEEQLIGKEVRFEKVCSCLSFGDKEAGCDFFLTCRIINSVVFHKMP